MIIPIKKSIYKDYILIIKIIKLGELMKIITNFEISKGYSVWKEAFVKNEPMRQKHTIKTLAYSLEEGNENIRRERLGVRPLKPGSYDTPGFLRQPGYEELFGILGATLVGESEDEIMQAIMQPRAEVHVEEGDNRPEPWSFGNEIILRDTVSQLCFALKYTQPLESHQPGYWEQYGNNEFKDSRLGAINITDTGKVVKEKFNTSVFYPNLRETPNSRINVISKLAKNMAGNILTSSAEDYKQRYFELVYQAAIEGIRHRYNRLSAESRKRLKGGGKKMGAKNGQKIMFSMVLGLY